MFALVALLVLTKKIGKASVNFFRVGHTHEDLDQLFGQLGTFIRSDTIDLELDPRRQDASRGLRY